MAPTRKTLATLTTAWLLTAAVGLGQDPARFRQDMARAHVNRDRAAKIQDQGDREAADAEFAKLILANRGSFAEVPAAPGDRARYGRVNLNAKGGGLDAIRFRVPSPGKTYQLYWSIAVPGHAEDMNLYWTGIVPIEGEELILTYPEHLDDVSAPGLSLPEPNHWLQYRLYGRKLDAGKEYLLWFDLKTDQPLTAFVKVRVEPLETAELPRSPALVTARSSFQSSIDKQAERYDAEVKAARRKYLGELTRATKATTKKNAQDAREIAAEVDRVNLGDSEVGDPRGFRVLRAETGDGERWNDVTTQVRAFVRDDRLKVKAADFDFKQDAAPGVAKTLIIVYTVDGKPGIYSAPSEWDVDLPPIEASPAKKP